jgi:CheY-like chemotaxis protein
MEMYFGTVPIEEVPTDLVVNGPEALRPVVLVVDDDPMIAFTQAAILSQSGLAALTAENGQEALEIAGIIPPDVLLTDLLMPGMGGLELSLAVRRIAPDCKFILCTGLAMTAQLREEVRRAGPEFAILTKPVHPLELLACTFERLGKKFPGCSRKEVRSAGSGDAPLRSLGSYRLSAA